jgi:hypothetical protein
MSSLYSFEGSSTTPAAPDSGVVSSANSSSTPLAGGATFTGTFEDLLPYANLSVACAVTPTNATGTVYADFSTNGVDVDSTVSWPIANGTIGVPHFLTTSRRYYRIRVVNDATPQVTMRLQVLLYYTARIAIPTTRITQTIDPYSDALNARAVINGANQNGTTFANVGISERDALRVEMAGPLGAFGELMTMELNPRVQIDAVYGLPTTDTETFTGSTGSATGVNSLFTCQTGVGIGGYGVIRSRRTVRYMPGQGLRLRFTAAFTSPGAALSLQLAGGFTSTDGLFFGFNGTSFGLLRRIAGAAAIMRLTVTVGTGGAETATVTLNGVGFAVALGAGLTTARVAEEIAERVGGYTGWTSAVSPQSNGSTVTFIQGTPATTAGAFTLTSTGTAAGTFATVQAGAANDDTTGFVPQASWNVDTLDGSDTASNPSGMMIDPTKLNVFEIVYPYLGAGSIRFRVQTTNGNMVTVHRIEYPNTATIPSQKNPVFRLGWIAASLGSTTNLTVIGASAAGFVEGPQFTTRDPFTFSTSFTADTNNYVAFALRSRGDFGGTVSQRLVLPHTLITALETTNRVVRLQVYINPTLTGIVNWQYVNQSLSCMEYATMTAITPSGGTIVSSGAVPSGSPYDMEIHELDLRLEAGDIIVVTAQAVSGSAVLYTSMNWQEI